MNTARAILRIESSTPRRAGEGFAVESKPIAVFRPGRFIIVDTADALLVCRFQINGVDQLADGPFLGSMFAEPRGAVVYLPAAPSTGNVRVEFRAVRDVACVSARLEGITPLAHGGEQLPFCTINGLTNARDVTLRTGDAA